MTFPKPCIGVDGQRCPTRAVTKDRSGRCPDCRRRRWRSQPTSTQRGYDQDHRALREHYRVLVEAGMAECSRCHEPIAAGEDFDLDHTEDRTGYLGPSHVACNRAVKKHR